MKRIVICCDGTWNRLDGRRPTNVARLAKAVSPRSDDGAAQVTLHLDGVGAGRGVGPLSRAIDRLAGGLFGAGLMANVETAYRFLAFNYAPGDAIFLFGFSRGAFMARTIAGLIRNCGIPEPTRAGEIGAALALYRSRGAEAHPDATAACAFRADFAPHLCVSDDDAAWRRRAGRPAGSPLRIAYIGAWDTVGALGLPRGLALARWINSDLRFHDTRLSRGVLAARHAVAIDERRRAFPPTLWDNLDELNSGRTGPGTYEQRWFPGDHGAVGGGVEPRLSNDALLWVAEGAKDHGLALDPKALAQWASERDCMAAIPGPSGLAGTLLRLARADRAGPEQISELAPSALTRWRRDPGWRPGALERVAGDLDAGLNLETRDGCSLISSGGCAPA